MSPSNEVNSAWQIQLLLDLYRAALSAADPLTVVPQHLPKPPRGRTVVIGVGKAAASMAKAVEAHWHGPISGVVVVPLGAALPLRHIHVHESSHPVPDERSVEGAEKLLAAVSGLSSDDLVIALISGGGSALCSLPAEGLSLHDKQHITVELLRRGASISEFNVVRRHLSRVKGGRLAARAHPARVVSLIISDIPGDDPALVASGPTLADPSTCADALAILHRYRLDGIGRVKEGLASGLWESVKPGDFRLAGHAHHVIATGRMGLEAAAAVARARGYNCHVLSDAMEGESREIAKAHAAIALSTAECNQPFQAPCILLSGGEATVTLKGNGRGGRNTEFVLALALALDSRSGADRVYALSAGTDGLDGRASAAGAWMTPSTLEQVDSKGLSARDHLEANDSATALDAVSSLVHTGPTHTNINDFRAVFVGER